MKTDLSKVSTDKLLNELYSRDDVWIVQHYRPNHIQDLSKEVLVELKESTFWADKISEELSENIDSALENIANN